MLDSRLAWFGHPRRLTFSVAATHEWSMTRLPLLYRNAQYYRIAVYGSVRRFFPIWLWRLNVVFDLAALRGRAAPRGAQNSTDAEPSRMAECGFCFGLG